MPVRAALYRIFDTGATSGGEVLVPPGLSLAVWKRLRARWFLAHAKSLGVVGTSINPRDGELSNALRTDASASVPVKFLPARCATSAPIAPGFAGLWIDLAGVGWAIDAIGTALRCNSPMARAVSPRPADFAAAPPGMPPASCCPIRAAAARSSERRSSPASALAAQLIAVPCFEHSDCAA
jgi:hypothetical protein